MIEAAVTVCEFPFLQHVSEIDSTNRAMLERPFASCPLPPSALWADVQHAGRGRRDRRWQASPGRALLFSVALESPVGVRAALPAAFSLVAGLELHGALVERVGAQAAARLSLKWPNDLLLDGRKLAGILIESRRHSGVERLVVGIGLNLLPDPARPPEAASLAPLGLAWDEPDCLAFIARLCERLAQARERHRRDGFAPWQTAWARVDAFAGREVVLRDGERPVARGRCVGVDGHGALLLEADGATSAHVVGDLSLREQPPDGPPA